MTPAQLRRAAIKERERRIRLGTWKAPDSAQVETSKVCHPKQAKLVDTLVLGQRRNVCCLAGRQSGKSHGGSALAPMLRVRRETGVNAIVVTSTYATCKKMAFLPAVELNRSLGLGGTPRFATGEMSISFPNGSTVYYLGADNSRTIERLRGTPNLVLVVIDEAGIYESDTLESMVKAVRPGLRPRAGVLCIEGTPSPAGKQGTWYDITENPEYDQHRFGYLDNDRVPAFDRVEELIDEDLRAQGLTRESAWFKREYLALFEVDLAEKVYQLTNANLVDDVPDCEMYLTGGDIGVSANDALVSLGWSDDASDVYVVDQIEVSGQDSLAYAGMVDAHNTKRRPLEIAVDPGGLGQKTIKTVQSLFPAIPITEAKKPPIGIQVRAVNTLLQNGRLKIKRGSKLALELSRPTWVDGLVGGEIDEHGQHSDLVPSLRYGCLAAMALLPEVLPQPTEAEKARQAYLDGVAKAERHRDQVTLKTSDYDPSEFSMDLFDDI